MRVVELGPGATEGNSEASCVLQPCAEDVALDLEIGAFVGDSTNVFLDAGASVLSVDPWNEQMPGYEVKGELLEAGKVLAGAIGFHG